MKHRDQILALLNKQIENPEEVQDIDKTAQEVADKWVNPLSGGKEDVNGLIYGLVQSGKTGVLSVTGALGADEGYRTIIILTSDILPLYEQTLGRVHEAFPGMEIIGKKDFKDVDSFLQRVKGGTCAIVTTKNSSTLKTLNENFQKGRLKGLSCLLIDDEADQASLNTKERKADGTRSTINARIVELRRFFDKNTYLQVTATPQALFLQSPAHDFRPQFTVLSHPGAGYVGGDDFFGDDSKLVREFPLVDITVMAPGPQPSPSLEIPKSLIKALDTFMVAATFKRRAEADQNCAFLCHVSTRNDDHAHIEGLLRRYKADLAVGVKAKNAGVVARLKAAYDDLSTTHEGIKESKFDDLLETIGFFSAGIIVKLVNGQTDEDVAVRSPYNLFVGGNKLGRGVTIKNLLVSYYGRHPKNPQADTVLQHARMYGYRRKDIGLLRLFLPQELHIVFKAIDKMEKGLRELIARHPTEEFRGVFLDSGISATRRNVLSGAVGVYTAGGNYNPAQMLNDDSTKPATAKIDKMLADYHDGHPFEVSISDIVALISMTMPDATQAERIWDPQAVSESVSQFAKINKHKKGCVFVAREHHINVSRRETQGVLSGGQVGAVPADKIVLFMFRNKPVEGKNPSWWPQIRFPDGRYAFAFSM